MPFPPGFGPPVAGGARSLGGGVASGGRRPAKALPGISPNVGAVISSRKPLSLLRTPGMIATGRGSPQEVIRSGNPNWRNWINAVARGQQLDWGRGGNPIAGALLKEARKRFPGLKYWGEFATSGHVPNSQHYRGNAIDIGVPNTGVGLQFYDWLKKNQNRFGYTTELYDPAGDPGTNPGDHNRHIHIDWGPRSGGLWRFNPPNSVTGIRQLPKSYWTPNRQPPKPRVKIIRARPAPRPIYRPPSRYNYGYSTYRPAPPRGRISYGTPQRRPTKSVARTYKGAVKRYF
jgi:hypothetical protein